MIDQIHHSRNILYQPNQPDRHKQSKTKKANKAYPCSGQGDSASETESTSSCTLSVSSEISCVSSASLGICTEEHTFPIFVFFPIGCPADQHDNQIHQYKYHKHCDIHRIFPFLNSLSGPAAICLPFQRRGIHTAEHLFTYAEKFLLTHTFRQASAARSSTLRLQFRQKLVIPGLYRPTVAPFSGRYR